MAADTAPGGVDDAKAPKRTRLGRRRRVPVVERVVTSGGAVLCERCEIAGSAFARIRGLMGRDGLEPGGGMLIDGEPSVHTFFMRFPIDVVFVNKSLAVVKIVRALPPRRVTGARKAAAALELPAGAAERCGLQEGETLTFEPIEAEAAS